MAEAQGGCHCGAVRFRATLAQGRAPARRCTCSYCRMKGGITIMVADGGFRLLSSDGDPGTCRLGSGVAAHHFCRACGINTHHHRSSAPGRSPPARPSCGRESLSFSRAAGLGGEHEVSRNRGLLAGVLRYSPA
ncbi:GFA family protein [Paracoccus niistensis]|uniref:GFA family protein n=1 Tax=Paracoccus niistensis TaxID=632935 RepID=UPI00406BB629